MDPENLLIDRFQQQNDTIEGQGFRAKNEDILTSLLPGFDDFRLSVKEFFENARQNGN